MQRPASITARQFTVNGRARWQSTASGPVRTGSRSWGLRRKYIFPILLFSAVSSLAINVRNAKDDARILEDQHAAQLSVLRDLLRRLQAGDNLSQQYLLKEYERVGIIKRAEESQVKPSKHITWRETLFGRKKEDRDLAAENKELADIEQALHQAAETADSMPAVPKSTRRPDVLVAPERTKSSDSRVSPTTSEDRVKGRPPTVII